MRVDDVTVHVGGGCDVVSGDVVECVTDVAAAHRTAVVETATQDGTSLRHDTRSRHVTFTARKVRVQVPAQEV